MISFGKFCDILDSDKELKECAKLMATSEKSPEDIVESVLEDNIVEDWKSWLGGMKKAAGQIAGGIAGGISSGSQRIAQGVRQAQDTMSGPLAKFEKAIETLRDLEKMLRSNPATKGIASKSAPKRSIAGYVQAIYQALEKERSSMPQMVGKDKLGSETPDKYLRGSQIEKRRAALQPRQTQAQQTQTQNQQAQNPEGMTLMPPMRLAQ